MGSFEKTDISVLIYFPIVGLHIKEFPLCVFANGLFKYLTDAKFKMGLPVNV